MKKLLVGLLALGSISSFANNSFDCNLSSYEEISIDNASLSIGSKPIKFDIKNNKRLSGEYKMELTGSDELVKLTVKSLTSSQKYSITTDANTNLISLQPGGGADWLTIMCTREASTQNSEIVDTAKDFDCDYAPKNLEIDRVAGWTSDDGANAVNPLTEKPYARYIVKMFNYKEWYGYKAVLDQNTNYFKINNDGMQTECNRKH
jgi:hypothetical protein